MEIKILEERIYHWLDERLGLAPLIEWSKHKMVPVHRHSFWYYMGGIALIFIITQIVTGMLLMVYYIPDLKSAHSSILNINSQIDFGWFIRSLHAWGANLLILALFFHFFSTYLMKAYRPPREITWWTGLYLMGLVLAFGFSGYLLPWDQVSFFATKVGMDTALRIPLIGHQISTLLIGGSTLSQETLSRFFTLHVVVFPFLLLPVLGIHLLLIQIHGTSAPPWFKKLPQPQQIYEKFFPNFILKDFMGWMVVLNILAILATIYPTGVGPEAQPFQPAPRGIKPEWYFLAPYQFLKLFPGNIGPFQGEQVAMLIMALVPLSVILIPFWDTGVSVKRSKIATYYGVFLILAFIILTIWGYFS